jgi:transcriptional regulator with XRE-family HTH domain
MAAARRIPPERPNAASEIERVSRRVRENVGRNLLRYRRASGLSQRRLSERCGVTQTYISQIESRKAPHDFGLKLIVALCVALGIEPVDLIANPVPD